MSAQGKDDGVRFFVAGGGFLEGALRLRIDLVRTVDPSVRPFTVADRN